MKETVKPQDVPPCSCHQNLGDSLLWFGLLLTAVVLIDRFVTRHRQRRIKETNGPRNNGAENGGDK